MYSQFLICIFIITWSFVFISIFRRKLERIGQRIRYDTWYLKGAQNNGIITLISKIITSMGTNTCGISRKCAFHAFRRIWTNLFHCKTANNVYLLYSTNKAIYTKEKWMTISELTSCTIIVLKTWRKNADRKNCTVGQWYKNCTPKRGYKSCTANCSTIIVQQIRSTKIVQQNKVQKLYFQIAVQKLYCKIKYNNCTSKL